MLRPTLLAAAALLAAAPLLAQPAEPPAPTTAAPRAAGAPRVGPSKGSVVVVGGGAQGPEIYARFIELAGGPDALIIDVPTAGGDSTYPADWRGKRGLEAAGARNVVVLHTKDRAVADADSFVAPIRRAGGVWFEGGRQWHLVDSYAGTQSERAFHDVLARGGVVGGTSAGASILASYLLRGARSGNTIIMAPGYEAGFGFLRGVAIDQHVVARERLRDLADSLLPRRPELLGISEDEGTAWVVRGDTAEIIGRNKAFVYGGADPNDPGRPFLTLRPGDVYDLGARRVLRRAIAGSPLTEAFVDSLVLGAAPGRQATVLVAQAGRVLVDKAYGVPDRHPRYMPPTTVPNFPLGALSDPINAIAARLVTREGKLRLDEPLAEGAPVTVAQYLAGERRPADGARQLAALLAQRSGTPYPQLVGRRVLAAVGAHKSVAAEDGEVQSNVDELYRLALGLESARTFFRDSASAAPAAPPATAADDALGWRADRWRGEPRLAAYGAEGGKRNAFVRLPSRRVSVIVLTDGDDVDARRIAERIAERLAGGR
jgi:cyanophycinase